MSSPAAILRLSAHAKINLSLRILGKRDDGFHALTTRMVPISIADEVEVERLANGATTLTCSDTTLPVDESNLALKALRAFEQRTGLHHAWRIHLEKHVPSGAGLGGGSSDAAAVLRALNELCGQPLSLEDLATIAGGIGSDVPFFLYGCACDARGRGEIVEPIPFPHTLTVVLIKPPFGIPTPWAYKNWASSLPLEGVRYEPQVCGWGELVNDLERPVFAKHLLLPALKTWLLEQTETEAALMSGSGSTMFAVVRAGADAQALASRAQAWCGDSTWVRVAQTLS
jgi:4-diphosphocytidyl-2-C-methyl-D-erythritol kinase